ncbi:MAG: c-type cytochrome [Pseudomonadota bacterium]
MKRISGRRRAALSIIAISMAAVFSAATASADESGRQIFLEGGGGMPGCAVCHTLSDAGSDGDIGPNLDLMKPDKARVRIAVYDGVGVMPAFGEFLSEAEIDAVADYVAGTAGE